MAPLPQAPDGKHRQMERSTKGSKQEKPTIDYWLTNKKELIHVEIIFETFIVWLIHEFNQQEKQLGRSNACWFMKLESQT